MNKFFKKIVSAVLSVTTAASAIGSTGLAGIVSAAGEHTVDSNYIYYWVGMSELRPAFFVHDLSGKGVYTDEGKEVGNGQYPLLTVDDKYVGYCIDLDSSSGSGETTGFAESSKSIKNKDKIALVLSYGYTGKTKYSSLYSVPAGWAGTEEQAYGNTVERIATQLLIWYFAEGWYNKTGSQYSAENILLAYTSHNTMVTVREAVRTVYRQILNNVNSFDGTKPSFDGSTQTLKYNSSTKNWSLTLTDTNNVVGNFNWTSQNGVTVSVSGNKITFTSSSKISNREFIATRKTDSTFSGYYPNCLVRSSSASGSNYQDCVIPATTDYYNTSVTLNAEDSTGDARIEKVLIDANGKEINPSNREYSTYINALTFRVYTDMMSAVQGTNNNKVLFKGSAGHYTFTTTVDSGVTTELKLNGGGYTDLIGLPTGQYYIREINGLDGWSSDAASDVIGVSVSAGESSSDNTVTFTNTPDVGSIQIQKELIKNGGKYSGSTAEKNTAISNLYFRVFNTAVDGGTHHPTGSPLTFSGTSSDGYKYDEKGSVTELGLNFISAPASQNLPDGSVNITNLPVGEYAVVENKRVDDNWEANTNYIIVEVDKDKNVTAKFVNEITTEGGLSIEKKLTKNGEDYKPSDYQTILSKITFQISANKDMSNPLKFTGTAGSYNYTESGGTSELKLNTSTGKLTALKIPEGTYWVKELGAGGDYSVVGDNPQQVTIKADGSTAKVTFVNNKDTGNGKIIKTFVNNSHKLSAAEIAELAGQIYFTVQNEAGEYIVGSQSALQSADGSNKNYSFSSTTTLVKNATHFAPGIDCTLTITGLPTGTYTVTEYCSAEGYEPTNGAVQTIKVEKGKTAEAKFTNTYRMPEIGTLATINGEKAGYKTAANTTIRIDDVITYQDLITNEKYTVKGVIYDKSTGKPFMVNGKEVTAEKTFTATNANGTVSVSFDIPASVITEKTSLVVFEQLLLGSTVLASHEDINDDGQTVVIHVPEIGTVATVNDEKDVFAKEGTITIKDVISYSDLIQSSRFTAGGDKTYYIKGTLYDKSTGRPFLVDGAQVTATKAFTTETENGTVEMTFTFDASAITKKTDLVVFEELSFHDVIIADEKDINSTSQTITVHTPDIGTTATVNDEKDAFAAEGNITLKDTVAYTDLIVGKSYTVTGVLMNKTTNSPLLVDGKQVTGSATFIAQTANGTVDVYFTFNASGITVKTDVVAYENLYYDGIELAVHADINDRNQTITLHTPDIGTTATVNNEKEIFSADGNITLKDTVAYTDLIVGKSYTVKGVLMDKSTNAPFLVGGKQVESQATFTATTANGSVDVNFTFDVSAISKNTNLVVFEELYLGSTTVKLAEEKNINNPDQTITVHAPTVGTVATVNGEHDTFTANKTITIKDVVSYTDLIVGKSYTVKGVLMDKATGEPFLVNGKEITSATTFTATAANGTANVTFVFDVSAITKNTNLVAYEELYFDQTSRKIAEHKDIEDKGQTITVHNPQIGTTATVGDNEKDDFAVGFVTIKDVVSYTDLVPNKEYKVTGVLMNKNTGKELLIGGNTVTSEATFIPTTADGTVEVTFTFDATELTENTKVVVFEHLYLGTLELTAHTDINDEGQTITLHKPDAQTTAIIGEDKEIFAAFGEITLTDTVDYTDLIIGKTYTVKGKLYDKATNAPFLVDGKEVTAETTFTATTADGSVEVTFTFDVSGITETTDLVAFENMYHDGLEIVVHADINDESQTIKVRTPHITTVATVSGETIVDEKEVFAQGIITVKDIVSYTDLIIGKEYTVKGILIDKSTGEAWIDNTGNPIAGQTTFTAEANEGSVEVTFTFDAQGVDKETDLVVFQKLYNIGIEICNHEDINDAGQTIKMRSPEIGTVAETDNGKKETFAVGEVTIVDTVEYRDLIVGKEYTVTGVLMNKATNKPLLIGGKEVTAETTFTAETTDGEVTVTFTFIADEIVTKTTVVAFETLYHNDVEFAVHADINDEDQTVILHKPSIHTTATINGEKEIFAPKHVTIIDTVDYVDLAVGEEYVVKGMLMNKATGNPYLINGLPVMAETRFTAETADGSIEVPFEFDFDPAITESVDFVVFQELYLSGAEEESVLATHEDINDEGQTITIKPNPPEEIPNTGVGLATGLTSALALSAAAGVIAILSKKKRKEDEEK